MTPAEFAASGLAARVRLGASPAAPPDRLLALAGDAAVTVRAAVAMNFAATSTIDRLLARDDDERVRTLLARKLAALIPAVTAGERALLLDQAMTTLAALVGDEASRVRVAIADVVKDMESAPRELILRLAHDTEIAVAGPVIRLSPLLTAADLLALLVAAPAAGTAVAVAQRPGLPESVADAIAASADTAAIAALLSNRSAAIREATLDALVARAWDHADWHGPLVRRPVLAAPAARALSEIVTTQLLQELCRRGDLGSGLAAELHRRLDQRMQVHTESGHERAMDEAHQLRDSGGLTEAALLGAMQRGESRQAAALLAVAAGVPVAVVERAAALRSAKGLVSLAWSAGFSMRVAGPLQTLLARLAPGAVLRAAGGGFPLAVEEMRWQIDFLTRTGR